ncbi:MAG TPA: hypothetical protein VFU05_17695, partial [Cyclobacteriaceae bacterium]|nr:hypothetical protein [Cyclobacteriaceae bacterium]
MEELNPKKPASPSEFYRMHRPEYFSDSMEIVEVELPKEVLSRELSLITTNLRTEEFETLCRKISEKLICPNLIPQVGPVGGGDGKTDFETYPVSNAISDRWFIPENGWDIDQKWAFAISAKETWKSKADSDIKKIVGTGRGFTRIYFITNQLPSSRERKEAEDDFKNLYKLDIVVLDGKWLLESIYENDLIELVVDVLNLSESFKKRTKQLGRNDTARLRELDELEKAIGSPNRYFEYDHQIVEDALQVAILSRMLERPRLELEGKFDRALRLCEKGGTAKQRLRIFYQRAWTMVNWYDDYAEFVHCYKTCKGLISSESSIQEVELLYNLINIFHGISASDACDLSTLGIDLAKEDESFEQLLSEIEADQTKPNAALTAKTQKCILRIFRSASKGANVDSHIKDLIICFESCSGLFEYPFEKYRDIIQVLGESFSNNQEFDKLFDCIANESEARSSQLAGGQTYMERGFQKLKAGINKDAIVYFGRAVRKLAKEESKNDIYFALRGLGQAYEAVGLLWASNSCYTAALEISLKSWFQGKINERSYNCAKELAENELLLGRFPAFLNWHELLEVLNHQLDIEKDQQIPFNHFRDACLAIRILNAAAKNDDVFRAIPDLLLEKNLGVSWLASQYRLGNIDLIRPELSKAGVNGDDQIQDFFERAATQPFRNQISHDLNFLSGDTVILSSTILGCAFQFRIERNRELVFATEMIIAFFEGFLATSFEGIFPHKEFIEFKVSTSHTGEFVEFDDAEPEGKLRLNLDEYGKARMVDSLILLVSKVL